MILSHFPIIHLDQPVPSTNLVKKEQLTRLLAADDIIRRSRQRAAVFLNHARLRRHKLRDDSRQQIALMQQQAEKQQQNLFEQARVDGTDAALGWLVEQQQWEQEAYQRLLQQISQQLAQRLQVITATMPWTSLLAEQMPSLLDEFKTQPRLTVRVAPDAVENLQQQLAELPPSAAAVVQVLADVDQLAGEAILENELIRIELKLPQQINALIKQLEHLEWESLDESD